MTGSLDNVHEVLKRFPRLPLWNDEPVIHEMERIPRCSNCRVFVLREDLIGFGLGGNKVRKLEFLLGDALARGATTVVTSNASSFSRNAAIACAAIGLRLHLVVGGRACDHNPLCRRLLDRCDVRIEYVENQRTVIADATERARLDALAAGETPVVLHPGGSDTVGAMSYVRLYAMLLERTVRTGVAFDEVILASGSTGTHVGLEVGRMLSGEPVRVTGVAVSQPRDVQIKRTLELLITCLTRLGMPSEHADVMIDGSQLGGGYKVRTDAADRARDLFLQREGILLDDTYSAKAAAAVLDRAADESGGHARNLLFIHTGGNGGLYY